MNPLFKNTVTRLIGKITNKTKTISLLALTLFFVGGPVSAASQAEINNLNAQINAARNNAHELQEEKTTLQAEIAGFDASINAIELEIAATQMQIDLNNQQIAETDAKIVETEAEIAKQRAILNEYLKEMYLDGQVSLVEQVVKSESFSDFVDQNEYLNKMQRKVKETSDRIIALKKELEAKKVELENKKKEIEALKANQVIKRDEINSQKAIKEKLLASVNADEARYQSLIGNLQGRVNAMQAEIARIAAAASAPRGFFGGGYKSYGRVSKGDIIGYQGNSGYSTGSHLHFELRVGGADTNPWPYVQNGTFTNPLPGSYITQYWGETGRVAGYNRHTGMDMSAGFGAPVRAAGDGEIIARVTGQGNTYPGQVSYGNYVMIRHNNGWVTIYGHLK